MTAIGKNGPIGRVKLSAMLGESERKVRSIVDRLKEEGIVRASKEAGSELASKRLYSLIQSITCIENSGHYIVAASIDKELLAILRERYLTARDYLVIELKDASLLKALMLAEESRIEAPGMPREYVDMYLGLARKIVSQEGLGQALILIFEAKRYNCLHLAAYTIHMLYLICNR
ncbi:MAG: hypothetical protein ABWW69_06550 [Pyrodictiaceae archaeon]